jgi:hypothetical protein
MTPFEIGFKYAALDTTVHEVVSSALRAHLPSGVEPSADKELERLLPEDGELEAVVSALENNFGVELDGDTVFRLFAKGTVGDLKNALVDELAMKKTADQQSHRYYMKNRAQNLQRARMYRMRNLSRIRRRSRIYRKKVKRRQIRPRRRVGTRGGGYTFIPR